jgi:hypothetical protein
VDAFIVRDEQILTGVTDELLVVADGGNLTLLGMTSRDLIIEKGGSAYIYGVATANVLNRGGQVEIYGVVGGYVYTDGEGDTWIDPNALIVATPPATTPTPLPTLPPEPETPVPTVAPETPVPTATPMPAAGMIDLTVSLYRGASTTADRTSYEEVFAHFADAVYEMSNGLHKVRNITVYENGAYADQADVVWVDQAWPCAYINGYGVEGYPVLMGDQFNTNNFLVERQCAGYVLAHEWGHYYYGMYDEYRPSVDQDCSPDDLGCPRMDDAPVADSIMNSQWEACERGDYAWLNFSVPRNQTRDNAQYRVYNASAWETLARPPSQDPRYPSLVAVRPRTYFPEFASQAPRSNQDASIELSVAGASAQSRSALNIVWAIGGTSSSSVDSSASISPRSASLLDEGYAGSMTSILGQELSYPEPVVVVAKVVNGVPIAKVDVRAGVLKPTGEVISLTLKDDGVPPDMLANDGLYSGLMPYEQGGEYQLFTSFNNLSGLAEFTEASFEYAPGPGGEVPDDGPQPVGENFYAIGDMEVLINDVVPDDHANVITGATVLNTDNVNILGRIDYSADIDMFEITALHKGKIILRVSDLAFDMRPRLQIWKDNGTALADEITLESADSGHEQYLFVPINLKANEVLHVAVADEDTAAIGGFYKISAGPALPNTTESPSFNFLLILLPLAGLLTLSILYFVFRPRRSPQRASAPSRRSGSLPSRAPNTRRRPTGHSIYKSPGEKDVEESKSGEADE